MRRLAGMLSALLLLGAAVAPSASANPRGEAVAARLGERACAMLGERSVDPAGTASSQSTARQALLRACGLAPALGPAPRDDFRPATTSEPDGTVIFEQRIAEGGGVAMDLLAYASTGLVVAGVLCYPDDGQAHTSIIHIHGGFGGLFDGDPGSEGMLEGCVDWALTHGRTAFVPSLRGQDGGEGQLEVCLGEGSDVASAVAMLRAMPVTADERVAVVGGSTGGCVALRAGALRTDLAAVVSFVPNLDWERLSQFNRDEFVPATETLCDGSTLEWDFGGPEFSAELDGFICGTTPCTSEQYGDHSPVAFVEMQTAPTLVVAAGADVLAPPDQQMLWSLFRQQAGHPVDVEVMNKCDPYRVLPQAQDVLIYVPDGYHLLSTSVIGTALGWMLDALDAPPSGSP